MSIYADLATGQNGASMKTLLAAALAALTAAACAAPSDGPHTASMPFKLEKATESYEGVAQQVLQVPSYTYVAVKTDGGDVRWAVSLKKRELHEGARVHVRSFGEKEQFESKKLGRTFDRLSFAVIHTEEN